MPCLLAYAISSRRARWSPWAAWLTHCSRIAERLVTVASFPPRLTLIFLSSACLSALGTSKSLAELFGLRPFGLPLMPGRHCPFGRRLRPTRSVLDCAGASSSFAPYRELHSPKASEFSVDSACEVTRLECRRWSTTSCGLASDFVAPSA